MRTALGAGGVGGFRLGEAPGGDEDEVEVIEEVGIVPDALVAEVGSPEMAATRGAVLPVGSQGNAAFWH